MATVKTTDTSKCFLGSCSVVIVVLGFEDMLKVAVISVLTDRGFQSSEKGQKAQLCASKLLEWMAERENRKEVSDFSSTMIHDLERCLRHPRKVKFHTLKERMWEKYFKLRASDPFRSVWANFLQKSIGMNSCPIFYQYVTDKLMESLIKEAFVGYEVEKEDTVATYLDCEESNALHYTAGFVLRSLAKTFIKSRLPNKDELLLCIREMTQGNRKYFVAIIYIFHNR